MAKASEQVVQAQVQVVESPEQELARLRAENAALKAAKPVAGAPRIVGAKSGNGYLVLHADGFALAMTPAQTRWFREQGVPVFKGISDETLAQFDARLALVRAEKKAASGK
jgi:hypothetical protein